MLDGCFRNVFYTPCDKKCGKSCLNGYKVLILHRISRRGFFPDAKVDKFGCLQPPEKMLKPQFARINFRESARKHIFDWRSRHTSSAITCTCICQQYK